VWHWSPLLQSSANSSFICGKHGAHHRSPPFLLLISLYLSHSILKTLHQSEKLLADGHSAPRMGDHNLQYGINLNKTPEANHRPT